METKNLEFQKTLTVEQFKREVGVDKILVKENPKTGRYFMQFGAATGAVAKAGIPKNPMISEVKGEPTEANPSGIFWLLHEEGTGSAPVVATF